MGGTASGNVPVIGVEGDGIYVSSATVSGPGTAGIYLDAAPRAANNACINDNMFVAASGLASAVSANGSNDLGAHNNYNGLGSGLTEGVCRPPLP